VTEPERRELVRRIYGERCGYCTVREAEAGTELEIDHFQPRSAGGGDELANLVYCCPACNRLKGDFWPAADPFTTPRRLLHPRRDDLRHHLREEADCRLVALTETGAFHLERLRLNRPPLIALRRARLEVARLRDNVEAAQVAQVQLRERIAALEADLDYVVAQIARLLESQL
jgi:hypothetical protein